MGRCRVLWEEAGAACAEQGQLQADPGDAAGHTWARSRAAAAASGERGERQDKMPHSEVRKQKWETALQAPRLAEEEGEEVLQDTEQTCAHRYKADIHSAAHREPLTRAGEYYLKEAAVCENLHLEQVKTVCSKEL